jgi:hypothetical protein
LIAILAGMFDRARFNAFDDNKNWPRKNKWARFFILGDVSDHEPMNTYSNV